MCESRAVNLAMRIKMHCFCFAFALLLIMINCVGANVTYTQFNLTAYKQMPALYHLDDYDLCLQQPPSRLLSRSTYCLVYVEIVANASSNLWQQIEQVSRDEKHHFRHDHLFVGVCLERCKQALHTLSKFQIQQLYEGKVTDKELSSYYAKVHKRASDEHLLYDHLINSCLNRQLGKKFQLRLRSSIEYCERADEPLEHDALDVFVYGLLILLLLLTVLSSYYDFRLKRLQNVSASTNGNLFYQQRLKMRAKRFLCSFSLCRNYYRLVMPLSSNRSKDLRFFDAFRVMGVFIVIMGHTVMIFLSVQLQNPEFFEQYMYRFETSIFQNGNIFIQIFFVMSAFLLYVQFTGHKWIKPKTGILRCIAVYFQVLFIRYFRLLPSLILLILCNGTILTRLGNGPLWRHLTEAERVFCRENWWTNVLFVNNFLLKESCAHQTWYLSAEMQLFALFLMVIIVAKKYPRLTRYIYIVLIALVLAVPALLTYYLKLDAACHLNPEAYRYLYFRNVETFYSIYLPFYTNIGGYLMGFLCAHLYLKSRSTPNGASYKGNWKLELGMWMLLPAALLVLFSGFIFIRHDFEKPSIWLALYASLYKNLWILICAGYVCCMFFKVGWLAFEFSSLAIFRPLARISFQAFLWHVFVLRIVAGNFREPVYVNQLYLFGNVISVFVLTQILAFFVALLFEYPLTELLKLLTSQESAADQKPNANYANAFQFELNSR